MDTRLKKIVRKRGITLTKLAEILGVSRVHITNIANGCYPAGPKLAKKIENWSNGAISHDELLYAECNSEAKDTF